MLRRMTEAKGRWPAARGPRRALRDHLTNAPTASTASCSGARAQEGRMREIQVFGGLSGRGQRPAGDPAGASFARAPRVAGAAPGLPCAARARSQFWPDIAEDAARTNLRSAFTELRQGLGIASRLLAADRKRVALRAPGSTRRRSRSSPSPGASPRGRRCAAASCWRGWTTSWSTPRAPSTSGGWPSCSLACQAHGPETPSWETSVRAQGGSRRTVSIVATLLLSLRKRASRSC